MNFKELLEAAKENDRRAVAQILNIYQPLLLKESVIAGNADTDLYQELCLTLLNCIQKFNV